MPSLGIFMDYIVPSLFYVAIGATLFQEIKLRKKDKIVNKIDDLCEETFREMVKAGYLSEISEARLSHHIATTGYDCKIKYSTYEDENNEIHLYVTVYKDGEIVHSKLIEGKLLK